MAYINLKTVLELVCR